MKVEDGKRYVRYDRKVTGVLRQEYKAYGTTIYVDQNTGLRYEQNGNYHDSVHPHDNRNLKEEYKPTPMKEVIRIPETNEAKEEKPVEFTHILDINGWESTSSTPIHYERIVFLGKCIVDGDMFAAYRDGGIVIFKGHLNSGKY
jgi:hypothetical protein